MEKPEVQVVRFESSVELASCPTLCEFHCGSQNPGCQGVCMSDSCPQQID